MIVFFILSLIGLLAGVAMQLSSLGGSDNFYNSTCQEIMFLGALVACAPAIYYSHKSSTRHQWISDVFSRSPKWLNYLTYFLWANLLVNCFVNPVLFTQGHPTERDGEFLLVGEYGYVYEKVTQEEYRKLRAAWVRAASSFWVLLFFGLVSTLFFNRAELNRCKQGNHISSETISGPP